MERFQPPDQLLNSLKCELCREYLSYPPITLHADTGSVCGRCPALEAERNITPLRESNYEMVARNLLLFPCRYEPQGCQQLLTMDEVPEHEDRCHLKPFFCPILPLGNCPWLGSPRECHMHFATTHQDFLLEGNIFEMNLLESHRVNYLLPNYNSLFLLHNEYFDEDSEYFSCLYQITPMENKTYLYTLEFSSGDGLKQFSSEEKEVLSYRDTNKSDGFKLNVIEIRCKLEYCIMITCKINITESITLPNPVEIDIEEEEEEEEIPVYKTENDKILLDLECPVCQEFMIPPIYQCQTGHSICGICKPQLRECPSCRGKLGETRNFTLEKLTEHIMYQCKNRYNGCDFKANCTDIKKHEQECKFSALKCPFADHLDCPWKGLRKKIISHTKESHNENEYLISEPLYIINNFNSEENGEKQVLTEVFGELFRVRLGYGNEKKKVYATVQFIGSQEEAKTFMYEAVVTDLNKKNLILLSKKFCGSFNDKKNDISHCSVWPLEMVMPFMVDGTLHMKYKITQVKNF